MTAAPLLTPDFLARLEQLELVSKKIFAGRMKGEKLSKRKGQSVEFADYRNYVVGDDLRFLDWNLLGRLDKLFIRLFHEEEDLHFSILIDTSMSMDFGTPTKLHYAKQLAAALAFVGLVNLDRVVIEAFSDQVNQRMPPQRGRRNLPRVFDFLEKLKAEGSGNFTQAMKDFSLRSSGKGIVVVLSDFLDKDGYEQALRYLVARRLDVCIIQILAQEEIDPGVVGDLKLVDIEDEDEAEITVSRPLIERYKKNLTAFRGGLYDFCTRRGVTSIFTGTQAPFEALILQHLRRRGLVR